ncbi:Peptidoglycan D,D-transpeptidase MrdA [Candidatus Erwinia haradaeae]|uniref:Peptidoglycan D,D-transpeptidase MrdA n=1 Tax=Candidatus Erwinia haradaeae TaxID=1922217 RepID=A0A451DJC9_9GAMM|nr:peptidoglycan DD-transpeptidase MrdA [Candidatus Erwinia haradaeae]VFP86793.1 Peptidoglycan D,D-transpeptidase MrdA [Candidatus Erwinia haradaeae]
MKLKYNFFRDYTAEKKIFVHREYIAFLGILLLSTILLINLYFLQIIYHKDYSARSNANRIKLVPIVPRRGLICDRNGTLLALNRTIYQLKIIPEKIKNLSLILQQLTPIVNLTTEELRAFQKERERANRFTAVVLKTSLSDVQIARFSVNQYRFRGVLIEGYQKRLYPYGSALTHVLGYVSKINHQDIQRLENNGRWSDYAETPNIGKLGIERYYENILHGSTGYAEVEVNNRGRVIRQLNKRAPQAGGDVYLSIDLKLQQYIATLLKGSRAAVVVTDPRSGEVLAMVSMPSYNPNLFVGGISQDQYTLLLNNTNRPFINRAIQGTYPPASTVKPYIAVAALTAGVITNHTILFDPGWWQLPKSTKRFRDWKRSGHGDLDIMKALEESSDTFFYQIAYDIGINRLSKWMKQFGYGCLTGIDLVGENSGIMPTRQWKIKRFKSHWYQGDTIPVGIGQGYWTATPVQMNKALMVLINNGSIKTPHFLLYTVQGDHKVPWHELNATPICKVNRKYWEIAQKGMYGVANHFNGTARKNFADAPYKIAAKSGTAQVFSLKNSEVYNANTLSENLRDHKAMIAYAPYDHPRIAVAVILENARDGISVGKITRQILDYYMISMHHYYNTSTVPFCYLAREER